MMINGKKYGIGCVVNGYKLLATYERFWLGQRPSGVRECFFPGEEPKENDSSRS